MSSEPVLTVEAVTKGLYKCGLKKEVAAKMAPEILQDKKRTFPRMITVYLYIQSGGKPRWVYTAAELQAVLTEVGFRPEVVVQATYPDMILGHCVVDSWIMRFANYIYHGPDPE